MTRKRTGQSIRQRIDQSADHQSTDQSATRKEIDRSRYFPVKFLSG
jgi:hypothetical protein